MMLRLALTTLAAIWIGSTAQAQVRSNFTRAGTSAGTPAAMGMNNQACLAPSNMTGGTMTNGSALGFGASPMMGMATGMSPNLASANGTFGGSNAAMMGMGSG